MARPLESDFEYYLEIREDLAREHDGKFAAIKDRKVLGIFEDYLEAANAIYAKHERGTVLMQPINGDPYADLIIMPSPEILVLE